MKTLSKILLAGAAVAPALFAALPANAQAVVAIADPEAAVQNSKAFLAANTTIKAQYKAQLDQAAARSAALRTELTPLMQALDTNKDGQLSQAEIQAAQAAKRPEVAAIETKQTAAQAEIARLEGPAARAQQYAVEQISAKLPDAVNAVVTQRKITLLVKPAAALMALPGADVTPAITAQLDAVLPSVSTTPPANWQPGQQGAASAAPAAAQPSGR